MSLTQIKNIFTRKNILYILFFIAIFFALGDGAFAREAGSAGAAQVGFTPGGSTAQKATEGGNMVAMGLATLLGLATQFVALFMHPGWYSGQIFDINLYLKSIWILISNVVYFIFAFLLIGIAFMNIIGKGEADFQLKTALPKLIVGILMVPFSWFIVQFILSVSALLTVSVLSLPYDTFKNYDFFANMPGTICTKRTIILGDTSTGKTVAGELGKWTTCDGPEVPIKDILKGTDSKGNMQDSIFSLISIYTYSILNVGDAGTLQGVDIISTGGIKSIVNLSVKVLFNLIFIVVYMILMLALALALFTRGVRLWLYMMISPVFGLMYFFGKGKTGVLDGKLSFMELINLAMVPVYVSAALAFGLLFIFVAASGMTTSMKTPNEWSILDCSKGTITDPSCALNIGKFSLTIKGAFGNGNSILGKDINAAGSAIGSLILQLFGIAILWIAIMAALDKSNILKAAIEPIKKFGEAIGKTASALPQYLPIIPGTGLSAKGLEMLGNNAYENIITRNLAADSRKWADSVFKGDAEGDDKKMLDVVEGTKTPTDISGVKQNVRGILGSSTSTSLTTGARADQAKDKIVENLSNSYAKALFTDPTKIPDLMSKLKSASTPESLAKALDDIKDALVDDKTSLEIFGIIRSKEIETSNLSQVLGGAGTAPAPASGAGGTPPAGATGPAITPVAPSTAGAPSTTFNIAGGTATTNITIDTTKAGASMLAPTTAANPIDLVAFKGLRQKSALQAALNTAGVTPSKTAEIIAELEKLPSAPGASVGSAPWKT